MESYRLPRFERASNAGFIELTTRDQSIFQLVHRYRFLRSTHFVSLLGESAQPIVRRLQLLYHNGYLERPRAQLDYYHLSGSRPIVYGLGNKGAALLRNEFGIQALDVNWGEKNRSVGRIYLEHALLVSDVMVAFELACRKNNHVRFIDQTDLLLRDELDREAQPFRWKAHMSTNISLGVIPD